MELYDWPTADRVNKSRLHRCVHVNSLLSQRSLLSFIFSFFDCIFLISVPVETQTGISVDVTAHIPQQWEAALCDSLQTFLLEQKTKLRAAQTSADTACTYQDQNQHHWMNTGAQFMIIKMQIVTDKHQQSLGWKHPDDQNQTCTGFDGLSVLTGTAKDLFKLAMGRHA